MYFFVPCLLRDSENEELGLKGLKVMSHGTIRNDDFWCNTALQYCCDIVSNVCNIVPTLPRFVALKIVTANRLV